MTVPITEYNNTEDLEEALEVAADNGGILYFADGSRAKVTRVGCVSLDKETEEEK